VLDVVVVQARSKWTEERSSASTDEVVPVLVLVLVLMLFSGWLTNLIGCSLRNSLS
jgi:hypothetical protein